jgi:ABC-type nitrate/sulfonate/bicarbonate transport system permease component
VTSIPVVAGRSSEGFDAKRAWRSLQPIAVLLAVVVLWQCIALAVNNPLFLPTLGAVAEKARAFWSDGTLLPNVLISLQRALIGFAISAVAGFAIGVLAGSIPWLRRIFDPLVALSYPIPKIGLIPLFILWLGIGEASKLAVIVTAAIYPVIINVQAAVVSIDTRLVWHAKSLGVNGFKLFWRVTLPATLPGAFVGLRLAMGLSWILLFAAEMVASNEGLGYLIIRSQQLFDTAGVFVSLVIIAVLGMMFDFVIQLLYRRLCHWHAIKG